MRSNEVASPGDGLDGSAKPGAHDRARLVELPIAGIGVAARDTAAPSLR